jgi:hypothetical protein
VRSSFLLLRRIGWPPIGHTADYTLTHQHSQRAVRHSVDARRANALTLFLLRL